MHVAVNGEPREIPDGATVRALIESLGLARAACAAEVNRALVARRDHDSYQLREGDIIELVTLVGGG